MAKHDLPRPEPVARAGVVAGAVAGLLITLGGLARAFGWLSDDFDVATVARQVSDLILGAGVLWSTVAPFVLAMWARGRVTPLADPRDDAGRPLYAEDEWFDVAEQATGPDVPVSPVVDPTPATEDMPAVRPAVPVRVEPTPIADDTAAALTQPAAAVRG